MKQGKEKNTNNKKAWQSNGNDYLSIDSWSSSESTDIFKKTNQTAWQMNAYRAVFQHCATQMHNLEPGLHKYR